MTELLTAKQMRALEGRAITAGEATGLDLMERAGTGVRDAIFRHWPEMSSGAQRAAVLCGPGNNGGDGFVVARLLRDAGWTVDVLLQGNPENLPPDAAINYSRWKDASIVQALTEEGFRALKPADLYIDALFGTGLSRPLEGELAGVVRLMAGGSGYHGFYQPRTVAIDVPSGLDADSGRVLGCPDPDPLNSLAPYAALTVSFDSPKAGHFLADGPSLCGRLKVCDIGIGAFREQDDEGGMRPATLRLTPALDEVADNRCALAVDKHRLSKTPNGHKYSHGAALVLSGGVGKGGAARLTARGALRIGAGLVTLGCPPAALIENAAQLNAIMLRKVADAGALSEILNADSRFNAIGIGPGFGTGPREAALLRAVLEAGRPCVLDADALTLLAQDADLMAVVHDKCVLTPHDGELSRLFPDIAKRLAGPQPPGSPVHERVDKAGEYSDALKAQRGPLYSKVDAVRDAAARMGCIVLLKGPDTVIAKPDGSAAICSAQYDRAAPWLATAGAGDVLAGFITGLLARGLDAFAAAETGAWLHQECALSFGPGLIAEDLPEELPKVFRQLGV